MVPGKSFTTAQQPEGAVLPEDFPTGIRRNEGADSAARSPLPGRDGAENSGCVSVRYIISGYPRTGGSCLGLPCAEPCCCWGGRHECSPKLVKRSDFGAERTVAAVTMWQRRASTGYGEQEGSTGCEGPWPRALPEVTAAGKRRRDPMRCFKAVSSSDEAAEETVLTRVESHESKRTVHNARVASAGSLRFLRTEAAEAAQDRFRCSGVT